MKAKYFPYLLILALALILYLVKKNQSGDTVRPQAPSINTTKQKRSNPQTSTNRSGNDSQGLDRSTSNIIISKHAKCRMLCRKISFNEVKYILKKGEINYRKSDIDETPEYALEGISPDDQHIRIVVAPEKRGLVLITCIDLDKDWSCDCK
ncbi:MAG: DUF4258 domain-containing protein [Chitinophagaceae bacterium]